MTTTPSGLEFEDNTPGTGEVAANGHKVTVHYTGWLFQDGVQGTKFDSSKDRQSPLSSRAGTKVLPACPSVACVP